jgi:uncharacterized membrane protein
MPESERPGAFGTPTLSGSSLALLFWWQSLTPTLIPRSWKTQAVVGAVCLAGCCPCGPDGVEALARRTAQHRASITPPEGWTEADTKRLDQFLKSVAGAESEPRPR